MTVQMKDVTVWICDGRRGGKEGGFETHSGKAEPQDVLRDETWVRGKDDAPYWKDGTAFH